MILDSRLSTYVDSRGIIHENQIGFRKGHRTADHLFTLRTFVDKYVQHTPRGKLYTCFVDFKKAFDSIWHSTQAI